MRSFLKEYWFGLFMCVGWIVGCVLIATLNGVS
jgi:hypothetical protein